MNFNRKIASIALATTLIAWAPEKSKALENITETKTSVTDILLMTPKQESIEKRIYNSNIAQISIEDMKWSPLEMWGIYDRENLKQFFWLNQYEIIFEKYNKDVLKRDSKWKLLTHKKYYKDVKLKFPRIHDSLKEYYPETLSEFKAKYPDFSKDIWDTTTLIIMKKLENWRFWLWYYKDWVLFLATHTSPWKVSPPVTKKKKDKKTWEIKTVTIPWWNNSPEWVYYITKSEYYKYKKSNTFELSPMQYAMQITWWIDKMLMARKDHIDALECHDSMKKNCMRM